MSVQPLSTAAALPAQWNRPAQAIAGALRARKGELARRMLPQVLDGWDKFTTQVEALQGGTDEFIRRELLAFPDYLSLYFQTGDEDYKSLYIGEKRKQFYDAKLDAEARAAVESRHPSRPTRRPCAGLADAVDSEALALLDATLDDIRRVITTWGGRKLDVLLIGDCVHLDVLAFLMAPCLEDQVSLETTFVTSKNPVERQAELKAWLTAGSTWSSSVRTPTSSSPSTTHCTR